jgi:RHS repeat-associated protein
MDFFGARYMSSYQGRFSTSDPTFLNVLKVTDPQRWNLYAIASNNPLGNVDPDGEEAIAGVYPEYDVAVHGDFTLPLGHAGVVIVDPNGSTTYFEYGRYSPVGAGGDVAQGVVRNAGPNDTPTPPVEIDASGKITPASMKALLGTLSDSSGKHGAVEAIVLNTNDAQTAIMKAYLQQREAHNKDQRQHYRASGGHNCCTLICESLSAAGRPAPFFRSLETPSDIFSVFLTSPIEFGVTQFFVYEPEKKKPSVSSQICYYDGNSNKVCQ